jgi:hypothetical protein
MFAIFASLAIMQVEDCAQWQHVYIMFSLPACLLACPLNMPSVAAAAAAAPTPRPGGV